MKPASTAKLPPTSVAAGRAHPPAHRGAAGADDAMLAALPRAEAAALWALRREEGLDAAGEQACAAWLASDPAAAAALAQAEALNAVFERARQGGVAGTVATTLQERATRRQRRRRRFLAVGAGVAGLAVAAVGMWWSTAVVSPRAASWAVAGPAAESPQVLRLPDGSLVECRGAADVRVDFSAGVRRLELVRGEAHFQVMPDASRPFVVATNGVEVRAVGTAFTVQQSPAAVEVVVTEGQVEVARAREEAPAPVTAAAFAAGAARDGRRCPDRPGSGAWCPDAATPSAAAPRAPSSRETVAALSAGQAVVVATTAASAVPPQVSQLSDAQLGARLAWRQTRLDFAGEELASAVARINRLSRVQIVLGDAALGRERVSGTFQADQPESFARILAGAFDLEVRPEAGARLVLSRRAREK